MPMNGLEFIDAAKATVTTCSPAEAARRVDADSKLLLRRGPPVAARYCFAFARKSEACWTCGRSFPATTISVSAA